MAQPTLLRTVLVKHQQYFPADYLKLYLFTLSRHNKQSEDLQTFLSFKLEQIKSWCVVSNAYVMVNNAHNRSLSSQSCKAFSL